MADHSPSSTLSDQELLQQFRKSGNNTYLGILLQRYTIMLFGVCMKYLKQEEEARDAVQQVFTKVITEIHRHEITFFKSWIYMVARNHCLMQLRGKPQMVSEEIITNQAEFAADILSEAEGKARKEQLLQWLEEAVAQLNAAQQQCITSFFLQKKSYRIISEEMGMDTMQVKSNIQNGKRNIRLYLQKKLQQNHER